MAEKIIPNVSEDWWKDMKFFQGTLEDIKNEYARERQALAPNGYPSWNVMECHLKDLGLTSWAVSRMHGVAIRLALRSFQEGWNWKNIQRNGTPNGGDALEAYEKYITSSSPPKNLKEEKQN